MSRPASYHDPHNLNSPSSSNDLALPLFNNHQTFAVPNITTNLFDDHNPSPSSSPALAHFPLPSTTGAAHQSRHSIAHHHISASPHSVGPYDPPRGHRKQGSMSSALPYTSQHAHHQSQQQYSRGRDQDMMLPPSIAATSSLGNLARSASLGRRKDPYSYSSDDVESGLGSMDMGSDPTWPGYGGRTIQQQPHHHPPPPPIAAAAHSPRDVVMSPARTNPHNTAMNPPPIPSHALARPPVGRFDSGGSSPSRQSYSGHTQRDSFSNPYIPRGSDPGPSVPSQSGQGGQWTDYRRPQSGRMPSAGSYSAHSPVSEHQLSSPYLRPDMVGSSPHSPMPNPYESSSNHTAMNLPPSPRGWPSLDTAMPLSPDFPPRTMSQQGYPASQPATPARGYDAPPPRFPSSSAYDSNTSRTTQSSASKGFRKVRDKSDLRPVTTGTGFGRRADPDAPGRFLSVSRAILLLCTS